MNSAPPDPSNLEDLALMKKVAQRDEQAFEDLVRKYERQIVSTISRMTNQSPDTEDLAQEVFVRLWKSAPRYQASAKFTTFLFTIARNLVFNYSGKKSRHKEQSLEAYEQDNPHLTPRTADSSPDRDLEHLELQQRVDAAIASLPEKQRLAVILRQQEKLPYEELAVVLELSIPAVKSTLFRARNSLREKLQSYLTDKPVEP